MPPWLLWFLVGVFWKPLIEPVAAHSGGPPLWPDGQVLNVTGMGIGSVGLSWPVADNNVYELTGYLVYYALSTDTTSQYSLAFNGTGFPSIRQYLLTGLEPGMPYNIYIIATNYDVTVSQSYSSAPLNRAYTVASPIGLDLTVVPDATVELIAGIPSTIEITGIHPLTGLEQSVGPVCIVSVTASCIPGRTFVGFVVPVCELENYSSECVDLTEANSWWASNRTAAQDLTLPMSATTVAVDQTNTGKYALAFSATRAGRYALAVQAITPGQLLGVYWDNHNFQGTPIDVQADAAIDFEWGTGPIVQYVSDYISVRWTGFIKPESSGSYALRCLADGYCNVWLDDVLVISSTTSLGTEEICSTGCDAVAPFQFSRAHYYKLRVEYVSLSGDSFIHLQWSDQWTVNTGAYKAIPSSVLMQGAFIKGSPILLTVAPNSVRGTMSVVYGSSEAMLTPLAGKRYTLFVRGKDEYGNACTSFDPSNTIAATITSVANATSAATVVYSTEAIPMDSCVYSFQVSYGWTGEFVLSVTVDGESVSNSPIIQSVVAGDMDPIMSIIDISAAAHVNETFNVSITAFDAGGNFVNLSSPSAGEATAATLASVQYSLYRRTDLMSSTDGCGTRSNITWLINCWNGEFSYIDDSQLIPQPGASPAAQIFPSYVYVSPTLDASTLVDPSTGRLVLEDLVSLAAGPHELAVWMGDTLVSGEPVSLSFSIDSLLARNQVVPSMSLVQFHQPLPPIIVYETDILARVLLRDAFGNPVTNSPLTDVTMVFAANEGTSVTSIPCVYEPNKYYSCNGYASTTGLNTISVLVNSEMASVIVGGPPLDSYCVHSPFCGTPRCPCRQSVVNASISLNISSF